MIMNQNWNKSSLPAKLVLSLQLPHYFNGSLVQRSRSFSSFSIYYLPDNEISTSGPCSGVAFSMSPSLTTLFKTVIPLPLSSDSPHPPPLLPC